MSFAAATLRMSPPSHFVRRRCNCNVRGRHLLGELRRGRAGARNDGRRLQGRGAHRPRGDGRGLPRRGGGARAQGRAQGDRPRARPGRALPRALPARVADRGLARPPARHPHLPGGRRGRRCSSSPCATSRATTSPSSWPRTARSSRSARVELLSQIAEALDAAHEKGLVHRDVKPSNVLIAESAGREHCYLGDFGLTKRTGSLSGVSVAGEIVGTLEYVAPEQITGDPLDERSDVYSLGCVLYECLTGQSPFPRATDVALLWAHVHEEPTPPSKARPDLPKELDTVLARALAKEPGRRYRSAGELLAATRSALRLVDAPAAADHPIARRASASRPRSSLLVVAAAARVPPDARLGRPLVRLAQLASA